MSTEEVLFDCLGCIRPLVASRKYIDCKVRCASCNLAMLVPMPGQEARYFDSEEAKLNELDTHEIQSLRRLSSKASNEIPTLRNNDSDKQILNEGEAINLDGENTSIYDTQEIKSLSSVGRELVEPNENELEKPEIELDLLIGSKRILPPRPKTEEDLPIQVEVFRDEGLFEDTYLKPKRITPSKTIRGERRRPQTQVKKSKINYLMSLLFILLIGVLIFFLIKKPSLNDVYQFLGIENSEGVELEEP